MFIFLFPLFIDNMDNPEPGTEDTKPEQGDKAEMATITGNKRVKLSI